MSAVYFADQQEESIDGKEIFTRTILDNYIDFVAHNSDGDFIGLVPDDNILDSYYATAIDYIATGQNDNLIATDLMKSFMWHAKYTSLLSFANKAALKICLLSWSTTFVAEYKAALYDMEPSTKRRRLY